MLATAGELVFQRFLEVLHVYLDGITCATEGASHRDRLQVIYA